MFRSVDSAEVKSSDVTGEQTHLAAAQLSWKLLSKDGHVARAQPITFHVITIEPEINVTRRLIKGAL